MSIKLDQYFDKHSNRTKFRARCRRCNRGYPEGINPVNAQRHGTRRGLDEETGLCRLCKLQDVTKELGLDEQVSGEVSVGGQS